MAKRSHHPHVSDFIQSRGIRQVEKVCTTRVICIYLLSAAMEEVPWCSNNIPADRYTGSYACILPDSRLRNNSSISTSTMAFVKETRQCSSNRACYENCFPGDSVTCLSMPRNKHSSELTRIHSTQFDGALLQKSTLHTSVAL